MRAVQPPLSVESGSTPSSRSSVRVSRSPLKAALRRAFSAAAFSFLVSQRRDASVAAMALAFVSSRATSPWWLSLAQSRAVLPLAETILASAPALMSDTTQGAWPLVAARCSAVSIPFSLPLVLAFSAAPLAMRRSTHSWWPAPAASMRAVQPASSAALRFTPFSAKLARASRSLSAAAWRSKRSAASLSTAAFFACARIAVAFSSSRTTSSEQWPSDAHRRASSNAVCPERLLRLALAPALMRDSTQGAWSFVAAQCSAVILDLVWAFTLAPLSMRWSRQPNLPKIAAHISGVLPSPSAKSRLVSSSTRLRRVLRSPLPAALIRAKPSASLDASASTAAPLATAWLLPPARAFPLEEAPPPACATSFPREEAAPPARATSPLLPPPAR
mmetsp:Transcript_19771/g.49955  ORF Transcript_19771/g.49955 Transcript_19771/m.49955 type:complete len:389 (+) Transcript_19771:589-1755(+)